MLKTNKRLISIILVVAIVLTMLTVGIVAFAKSGAIASTGDLSNYYLCGYIGGADYGCEGDYQTLGEYGFDSEGKLSTTFPASDDGKAYLFLKNSDLQHWYMLWQYQDLSSEGGTADLYNTTDPNNKEKFAVAAETPVTLQLVDNGDDSFSITVSYGEDPTTPPTPPTPGEYGDVYLDATLWNVEGYEGYFIHAWNDNGPVGTESLTNVEGDIYKVAMPEGATGFLFGRTDGSGIPSGEDWSMVWNQTEDLAPQSNYNMYVIDAWGEGTSVCSGHWDNYQGDETQATDEPTTPPTPGDKGYLKINGEQREVKAGDIVTWTYKLNVLDATQDGKVPGNLNAIDGRIYFDGTCLDITNVDQTQDDNTDMFPILCSAGSSLIINKTPTFLTFNGTKVNGYKFNTDDCVLFKAVIKVTQNFTGVKEVTYSTTEMAYTLPNNDNVVITPTTPGVKIQNIIDWPETPTEPGPTEKPTQGPTEKPTQGPTDEPPTKPTEAPTEPAPGNQLKVTVNRGTKGTQTEYYNVGDKFTYTYYLNVNAATQGNTYLDHDSQGYLSNMDARTLFDRQYVSNDLDAAEEDMFPIVTKCAPTVNLNDPTGILWNFSQAPASWGSVKKVIFNSDDCVLITCEFTALKAGSTTINTVIKDMTGLVKNLEDGKIVESEQVLKPFYSDQVLSAGVTPTGPTEKPTQGPTEAPTTKPTEAPTTKPTEAPTTKPTEAPTELDKVFIKADGKYYEVEYGQTYTYSYYLTTDKKVCSLDAKTTYDTNGLEWLPVKDDEGEIDLEQLFPVTKDNTVLNANTPGLLKYNYSSTNGAKFGTDAKLITTKFKVTKDKGIYAIDTLLNALGVNGSDGSTIKLIEDGKVVDPTNPGFQSHGVIENLRPSPTEPPTEEPPTEEPTQGPTEKPTQGPTEKPTQGPTEKPTETPTTGPLPGQPQIIISNVEVKGTVNSAIKEVTAEIQFIDCFYPLSKNKGDDLSAYFTNLPAGLKVTAEEKILAGAASFTVKFSGTPTKESVEVIKAEFEYLPLLKSTNLASTGAVAYQKLAVTENKDAKYNITKAPSPDPNKKTSTNDTATNTNAVKTGSPMIAVSILVLLAVIAGVIVYVRKKRFD